MKFYYFIIVIVCMIFSAFFSASDLIYGMIDQDRLKKDAVSKKSAKVALKLAQDYELSISTVLFGNNAVNVLASSIVTIIGITLYPDNKDLATTVSTLIFTVLLIIFCEFVPKAVAKRYNYKLGLAFAYPVNIIRYITLPIVWPISKFFIFFGKLLQKKSKEEDKIDDSLLDEMVDSIEESGGLDENEAEIVRGAIDLTDIQAYEIMTPRVDVFAISIDEDINELLKDEEFFVHSRIPVYEDTIDNIVGVLPIKALVKARLKGGEVSLKDLCYKPLFIPRNRQVLDLLDEFKTSHIHIAVVLDEYGGIEGIITMEDILEEIVGEIFDEMDEVEEPFIDKGNGTYIITGSMNIDDFFELIGFDPEENEFETDYATAGGFCQEVLDRFAVVGDKFDFYNYSIEILEADKYTVEKFKVIDRAFEDKEE